jgi:hypothetical protein
VPHAHIQLHPLTSEPNALRTRAPAHAHADPSDPYRLTDETRTLGLVVCRGTQVSLISPVDGMEEIANPFVAAEG